MAFGYRSCCVLEVFLCLYWLKSRTLFRYPFASEGCRVFLMLGNWTHILHQENRTHTSGRLLMQHMQLNKPQKMGMSNFQRHPMVVPVFGFGDKSSPASWFTGSTWFKHMVFTTTSVSPTNPALRSIVLVANLATG